MRTITVIFSGISWAVSLVLMSCASTPPEQPRLAQPASSSSSAPIASFAEGHWARFRSKRFELSIAFPDGKSWRIDDHGSPWLTARHPATDTIFQARVWHEANIVNAAACERRAHEWLKDLPQAADMEIIDERRIENVPAGGYDTMLRAGVITPKSKRPNAELSSVVLAFGASMKKCFAAVFISPTVGAASSAQSGERLAFGTRIVESAVIQSELDPPARLPP